ncbi:hypothetical protein R1sor_023264 [Riccia sorocarpa]|uniref:Protein kinase domain-containing protein n=1 Tax=Riccia sorocarpa TaxID=122646 RepID=A0ABD3GM93_9MARC
MEIVSSSCPFSSVEKKEAREHIRKMVSCMIARRKALGIKALHQGCTILPNGIVWVPNAAIKREKRLSEGTYREAHTCFVRGSLSFDESVLYCMKHYKSGSTTAATSERDREVLASRVRHPGVVRAIGVSIDNPPVALFLIGTERVSILYLF